MMFMRIDKLLCEMNIGSRSQVKEYIRKGQIFINGVKVMRPEMQVEEDALQICCNGKEYSYRPYVYYMMNKPSGIVTATSDKKDKTVLDLLKEQLKAQYEGDLAGIPVKDIFPVGRLDKDTVGLLLLTNNGPLAHRLLSPKKHVPKRYLVKTDSPLGEEGLMRLTQGVRIGEHEITLPAEISEADEENTYFITITEGKYHQVKRMFQAAGAKVIYLKRLSMGSLSLDEELLEGQIRELTKKEVADLC
ncbi:rRNA pseudouridine synthase [bacterium 1xD42-62]|uniref:Pseudouridine synthase n=2 Tax=Parablautia muri TaxID=2320879 RepID=A0A9X5GQX6_9FIRM|nr:rRNA pseudouridine synthase [Parablautia muri]